MIVSKTGLKKIPNKCSDCKYHVSLFRGYGYNPISGRGMFCTLCSDKDIPYKYISEKKNWCFVKPDWCPLVEIKDDMKDET